MGRAHVSLLRERHGYTRSRMPWIIDENHAVGRLYHYIAGGGMRTFGRTLAQDEADLRVRRFLVGAGVFFVLWLLLLIF